MGLSRHFGRKLRDVRRQPTVRGDGRSHGKRLSIESLESRVFLSAAGLVDVGAQPDGGLSGKITYIHGGHGYTTFMGSGANDFWSFQRGNNNGMVEDLGNQEQMTALADYLFRAGATVVPMRPVGHQPLEIILDNDAAEVTFSGAWTNSVSSVYFAGATGAAADAIPYKYASTSATETAYARYRPNVTTAGFYPVYAWTLAGSDRAADQLYRVNHSGGVTEVTVNHRRVGGGLAYLGTYHFEQGTSGYVDVSNRSSESGPIVVADMIRFGNGIGDIDRGVGISGRTREDEPALYWIKWHVDRSRGIPTSEYSSGGDDEDATVAASPKYSEFMNRQQDGTLADRLLISFHSNAANTTARGVTVLHNTNSGGATPNQLFLAQTLGTEIQADMLTQNGQFEHAWGDRGSSITYQAAFNYGELNNAYAQNEFDATIVEVGFHDNVQDAQLMRDPRVRDALARATYHGMVKYFRSVDGNATPLTVLPGKVTQVRAETVGPGSVQLTWTVPAVNSYNGDAATGYRIYGSTNGYGFDGGTFVAGGATTTFTLNGLDANEGAYFFKVVALNAGGEGAASEVVAAIPKISSNRVLIVNGFDRLERAQNPTQNYGGTMDRVRPRFSNSFDYAVQAAAAIEAEGSLLTVDSASNEFVSSGAVNLANYSAVVWILGEESTATDSFSAAEQTKVSAYLAAGGKLFVSGAEIGFDLDAQGGGAAFFNNTLKADYVADDANTYSVTGAAGSIFSGLSISFDNGQQFYNVDTPDRISPLNGSATALTYSTGGAAAIVHDDAGTGSKLVMMAFPFESITTASARNSLMDRVLEFFALTAPPTKVELVLDNDAGPGVYLETGAWSTATATGYNGTTYRFASAGTVATANWQYYAPITGFAQVFVQFRSSGNRATNSQYQIDTGAGVQMASANQTLASDSLRWVSLGTFNVQQGLRSVTLDALGSNGGSVVIADAVRIVLTLTAPVGDFDGDGHTDGADFLAWQRNVGATMATPPQGDADADAVVDADDLAAWRSQFGANAPAQAFASSVAQEQLLTVETTASIPSTPLDRMFLAQHVDALTPGEPTRRRYIAPTNRAAVDPDRIAATLSASPPAAFDDSIARPSASALYRHSDTRAARVARTLEAVDQALGQLDDWSWRESL